MSKKLKTKEMKMTKELNTKALKEIAQKSPTARAVFESLSQRERNRGESDLRRLKKKLIDEGFKIVPQEFVSTFKKLADIGIGELVEGRNGNPSRFRWHFSMKDIGHAGLDAVVVRDEPKPGKSEVKAKPLSSHIMIMLDNERQASFSIPQDISDTEANQICNFILQRIK